VAAFVEGGAKTVVYNFTLSSDGTASSDVVTTFPDAAATAVDLDGGVVGGYWFAFDTQMVLRTLSPYSRDQNFLLPADLQVTRLATSGTAVGVVKNQTSGFSCQVEFVPSAKDHTVLPANNGYCVSAIGALPNVRSDVGYLDASIGGGVFQSFRERLAKYFGPAEYMADGAIPKFVHQEEGSSWWFMGGVKYGPLP